MNTYLLKNDNTIILTESTGGIVEKSNSIDTLKLIMPKIYNDTFDMSTFDCLLEYKLPISNSNGIIQMELTDDNYKNDYILFSIPETTISTALTNECGEVEFTVHLMKAELQENGTPIERVRMSIAPGIIKILPISTWLSPSESALSSLAAMYLENKKAILALQALANQFTENKADGIRLDIENQKVILTSNGQDIGDGIDLDILNAELVTSGAENINNGNILINRI